MRDIEFQFDFIEKKQNKYVDDKQLVSMHNGGLQWEQLKVREMSSVELRGCWNLCQHLGLGFYFILFLTMNY